MFRKVKNKVTGGEENADDAPVQAQGHVDEEVKEEVKGQTHLDMTFGTGADDADGAVQIVTTADDAEFERPDFDQSASILGNDARLKLNY